MIDCNKLGFKEGRWTKEIDVADFIRNNITQYDGDESFLEGPTTATNDLWRTLQDLQKEERRKGWRP